MPLDCIPWRLAFRLSLPPCGTDADFVRSGRRVSACPRQRPDRGPKTIREGRNGPGRLSIDPPGKRIPPISPMNELPMEVRFGPVKQSHGTFTQQYFFAPLHPIQGECVLRFAHAEHPPTTPALRTSFHFNVVGAGRIKSEMHRPPPPSTLRPSLPGGIGCCSLQRGHRGGATCPATENGPCRPTRGPGLYPSTGGSGQNPSGPGPPRGSTGNMHTALPVR